MKTHELIRALERLPGDLDVRVEGRVNGRMGFRVLVDDASQVRNKGGRRLVTEPYPDGSYVLLTTSDVADI